MSDDKKSDSFWLNDPTVLFTNLQFIPNQTMNNAERLNALTRLLILITAGMYYFEYDQYLTVFILGLLLIIVLRSTKKEGFAPRRGVHDPCKTCGFDSSMSYINTKYEETPSNQFNHTNTGLRSYTHAHYKVIPPDVPAPYREIWQNEPRWCREFSQYPNTYNIVPDAPTEYLPSSKCHFDNTEWVENSVASAGYPPMGKRCAMPAIQSAFMRDSLEYRNNIMGDYIDQIGRTRQHNCVNFKPGRKTW
jgi:hypothetical protein